MIDRDSLRVFHVPTGMERWARQADGAQPNDLIDEILEALQEEDHV